MSLADHTCIQGLLELLTHSKELPEAGMAIPLPHRKGLLASSSTRSHALQPLTMPLVPHTLSPVPPRHAPGPWHALACGLLPCLWPPSLSPPAPGTAWERHKELEPRCKLESCFLQPWSHFLLYSCLRWSWIEGKSSVKVGRTGSSRDSHRLPECSKPLRGPGTFTLTTQEMLSADNRVNSPGSFCTKPNSMFRFPLTLMPVLAERLVQQVPRSVVVSCCLSAERSAGLWGGDIPACPNIPHVGADMICSILCKWTCK